jgi:hypothetical protein
MWMPTFDRTRNPRGSKTRLAAWRV